MKHKRMRWLWVKQGAHVHVRVMLNGALCGSLCFREEEFDELHDLYPAQYLIEFFPDPVAEEIKKDAP